MNTTEENRAPEDLGPDASLEPSEKSEQPEKAGKVRNYARQAMSKVSHGGKQFGQTLKKPTTGAALAGAAIVGSALVFGIAETAVGATAGYLAYRVLKKRGARNADQADSQQDESLSQTEGGDSSSDLEHG
jgi:hypothetical protein